MKVEEARARYDTAYSHGEPTERQLDLCDEALRATEEELNNLRETYATQVCRVRELHESFMMATKAYFGPLCSHCNCWSPCATLRALGDECPHPRYRTDVRGAKWCIVCEQPDPEGNEE